MEAGISIEIANSGNGSFFAVKDKRGEIIGNKRVLITLKRLNYETANDTILVPYRDENQAEILQELQDLLKKHGISYSLSSQVNTELESFKREDDLFDLFSQKAKSIRNNEFLEYPELVEDYRAFKSTLNENLAQNLYPLQELCAFHMSFAQNSCNFSVPGAGKTRIVYGAYTYLKNLPESDPRHVDKLLVIGPISSFAPWEKEYQECFGKMTSFQRLSGDINISKDTKLEHLYSANAAEITLIFHGGVDYFQNEITDFLKANKTMVVVDEAHRIKNPDGVWGKSIVEISKEAKARVILTGTPVPNGYQDIFNLYKFIYPFKYKEILQVHFQNLADMTQNSPLEGGRVQAFKENISPFFVRIKKCDLGLPPTEDITIPVNMEPHQREIYDFIEMSYMDSFKKNGSGTIKDILNKAKLIRLRQASTNPSLLAKTLRDSLASSNEYDSNYDPNSLCTSYAEEFVEDSEFFHKIANYSKVETPQKFKKILELLEGGILKNSEKVIIWSIFIQNAKDLQNYLAEKKILSKLLIGEIEPTEREKIIDAFNNPENNDFQVVIANPFSVAESISLHKGCHNAIYMERDYNCANFLQSKDRIHRVGIPKGQITRYFYLVSSDSIDEIIDTRLKAKIERMEEIINEDIPLFSRVSDNDETDIIKDLISDYARRFSRI